MEDISNELYELTEYITKKKFNNKWQGGGLLGGEYGYGVDLKIWVSDLLYLPEELDKAREEGIREGLEDILSESSIKCMRS